MLIIPLMIKAAPYLGMVDTPDPRKVHAEPTPRVGGVGIVLGTLLAIIIWLPLDNLMLSYLAASMVLFIFGALDDSFELGHYVKFIGQFVAVGIMVYVGDLWVEKLPFVDVAIEPAIGKIFTFFAIIGMVNAINHSDGLDGLAGGESLISLICIGYLAYIVDGLEVVVFTMAIIGGILGFMRFNNHPAQIFMGDAGSQFLGFTLAVLTIQLTQQVHTAVSMALPALILGLPVIDILAVFAQRIYHGMNWFRASKNHIHHRLLELRFDHYQSVVIIYSIQIFFVVSAVFLKYESDFLILSVYFLAIILLFGTLLYAEKTGWHALSTSSTSSFLTQKINELRHHSLLTDGILVLLKYSIPLYFIVVAILITDITNDFGVESLIIAVLLLLSLFLHNSVLSVYFKKVGVYAAIVLLVYLFEKQGDANAGMLFYFETIFFMLLAFIIFVVARYARQVSFSVTPFDYLMVILVLVAGIIQKNSMDNMLIGSVVVKSVILFYGCEMIINHWKSKKDNVLGLSILLASGLLFMKSILI
ncbi:MAG: undecaprenyl/decaprenyl-phosphate alpha-N-acetylglucosaminyl 1-phosphate transferase [Gammaproteobacteria bacterium]|nr:undecaprenyl/decaprenyl-phosphate alpha-N-acetylglucosaminyl 1-phosphate transferase [Gammaproteobacteria bacterium]